MDRNADARAFGLPLMEEPEAGREKGDRCGRAVSWPGELRCGARLVVVFQEADQSVLVGQVGTQMVANHSRITAAQPVIQALVVAVIEALLLQGPFHVPIGLGHKGEVQVLLAHGGDRLRPERFRTHSPGAFKDFGQQQHGHVAAHAVAFAADCGQLLDLGGLQCGIGVVELQRVGPAGIVRVAAMRDGAQAVSGFG